MKSLRFEINIIVVSTEASTIQDISYLLLSYSSGTSDNIFG